MTHVAIIGGISAAVRLAQAGVTFRRRLRRLRVEAFQPAPTPVASVRA